MNLSTILRQFLKDSRSLEDYLEGEPPSYDVIKSRLRILERENNRKLPDHYYKNQEQAHLKGVNNLCDMFLKGFLPSISDLLEMKERRVSVRHNKLVQWQEFITFLSPSFCISSIIYSESKFSADKLDRASLNKFIVHWILPSLKYSTLPVPSYPQFNGLVSENSGLHDLHVHLSGSTEIDLVFQYFLQHARSVSREYVKEYRKNSGTIREQMEQEGLGSDPFLLFRRFNAARYIRSEICELLKPHRYDAVAYGKSKAHLQKGAANTFKAISILDAFPPPMVYHPMRKVVGDNPYLNDRFSDIILEVLMYIMIFDRMQRYKDECIAQLFHCYLLIWGSINRLMVQQIDQFGFEQFGKIADNKLRDLVEKNFKHRFLQLGGNDGKFLRFLEARFSPKDNIAGNRSFLSTIIKDFEEAVLSQNNSPFPGPCSGSLTEAGGCSQRNVRPQLRLVAHLIKKSDDNLGTECRLGGVNSSCNKCIFIPVFRYARLYRELHRKANSLIHAKQSDRKISQFVTGIDAASDELKAPPEVFAPAFCYLRNNGFEHFTYHVGEDFVHILSGIRRIYEAVKFLDLRPGDRIGHATATAIDPEFWETKLGDRMYISRGEWLDNLIFAQYFIIKHLDEHTLTGLLSRLEFHICRLGEAVYHGNFSINQYYRSWLLRKYFPPFLFSDFAKASLEPYFDLNEWSHLQKEKHNLNMELPRLFHDQGCRRRYNELIEIEATELFDAATLRLIQNAMLEFLYKNEIVIEVLPTSNVRISFYDTIEDHHIWRLLNIKESTENKKVVPPVVVGSDDPGIFSTNIFIEYALIYETLVDKFKMDRNDAIDQIKKLERNSLNYRFE